MGKPSILVTGASGFVGAHIALDLAALGYEVIAAGGKADCADEVKRAVAHHTKGNLADTSFVDSLNSLFHPDVVVHAAALANAVECEKNPDVAEIANIKVTQNLASVFTDCPFVHVSTDLVFDGATAPAGGFSEADSPCPASVYGRTKYEAEQLIASKLPLGVVARICLVYGAKVGRSAGFMGWLNGALLAGQEVNLFVDEWRTPIYSADVSRGIEAIFKSLLDSHMAKQGIVHLAGPERLSRFEFGEILSDVKNYNRELLIPSKQSEHQSEVARPSDVSLNASVLRKTFGVKTLNARDGLAQF